MALFGTILYPACTSYSQPPDPKHELLSAWESETAEFSGFFSTEHQGVFTHHDSFVHIHLITPDKKRMGHVDYFRIKKGTAKLFLPED